MPLSINHDFLSNTFSLIFKFSGPVKSDYIIADLFCSRDATKLERANMVSNVVLSKVMESNLGNYESNCGGNQKQLFVHNNPSQVKNFRCTDCSYETKYKGTLTWHMLMHKDPSQVNMFRCGECSYQFKMKSYLKLHMLIHKDPSQLEIFKCNECSFDTKYKNSLPKHMLIHRDPSQVELYLCGECTYQSKMKTNLKRHMLIHKNPS